MQVLKFWNKPKITSFTSSTNDEYMNLAINSPMTLVANGKVDNAFDLGLGLASDAGVAKLEDKIAVIKLFAYWQNGDGAWEDAGDKLEIVGQTSSKKRKWRQSKNKQKQCKSFFMESYCKRNWKI